MQNEAQDHKTRLGTRGTPYRSPAGEELVALTMRAERAAGRPADRMSVVKALATRGDLAVHEDTPTGSTGPSNPSGTGRSLAEGMAIGGAQPVELHEGGWR